MSTHRSDISRRWKPLLSPRRGGYWTARARRAFTLIELIVVVGIIVLLTALTVTVAVGVVSKSEQRATANTLKLMDLALAEWETEAGRTVTWGVDGEPDITPTPMYDFNPDTPQTFNPNDATDELSMMNIIINKIRRSDAANEIVRQIDGEFLRSEDVPGTTRSRYELLDAWENPVYVVHPGRVADPRTFDPSSFPGLLSPQNNDVNVWRDPDGTIRVGANPLGGAWHPLVLAVASAEMAWEDIFGACKNRRVCFVSAGPDGEFGNLHLGTPAGMLTDAQRDDMQMAEDNVYSYELSRERPTP